jgi:site-specific DNA recombinase
VANPPFGKLWPREGHRLGSRQRESNTSQLFTPESNLIRSPRPEESAPTCELFSRFLQRTRKSRTAWRRQPVSATRSVQRISIEDAGLVEGTATFDENGEPLYVQGAVKGARHYRYYVSRGLVRGSVQDDQRGWRVSAPELERAVRAATQQILNDRAAIAGAIEGLNIDANRLPSMFKVAEAWIQSLRSEAEAASALTGLIERVGLKKDGIQISIKLPISSDEGRDVATPNEPALSRFVPMRMKRRGVEMRLIIDGDAASLARIDLPLLDATARAYRWSNDLLAGRARSIGEIARREHLTARHVRRVMRLAFLAPRIVEAIVEGRQPADLSTLAMTQRIELPPLWSAQQQALESR